MQEDHDDAVVVGIDGSAAAVAALERAADEVERHSGDGRRPLRPMDLPLAQPASQ